jgi:lambda repressor-like predicted transcriptional regulator
MGLSKDTRAILATATVVQHLVAEGINNDGSLQPRVIRALLRLMGVSLRSLAKANGYTDTQFHQVINGEYPDPKVRNIIAAALGVDPSSLWGPASVFVP